SDSLGVGFDVWIPQLGGLCAVPLSSQNGVHNGTARRPGDVTDMMDLQVHLRQRLVHVLYVLTGRCDQFVPMPKYCPHSADVLPRPKCSSQKSHRAQKL